MAYMMGLTEFEFWSVLFMILNFLVAAGGFFLALHVNGKREDDKRGEEQRFTDFLSTHGRLVAEAAAANAISADALEEDRVANKLREGMVDAITKGGSRPTSQDMTGWLQAFGQKITKYEMAAERRIDHAMRKGDDDAMEAWRAHWHEFTPLSQSHRKLMTAHLEGDISIEDAQTALSANKATLEDIMSRQPR